MNMKGNSRPKNKLQKTTLKHNLTQTEERLKKKEVKSSIQTMTTSNTGRRRLIELILPQKEPVQYEKK